MTELEIEPLARSINLRDLGGIAAIDGRQVRPGLVFRAAALSELTPFEHAHLAGLGLGSVIDLRNNQERAEHPTPWKDLGARAYWALDYEPSHTGGLSGVFGNDGFTREIAHAAMVRTYRDIAFRHVDSLRRLFGDVARGAPVLFHCTSGKDRTGVAAAMLLTALGVAREAIAADYLRSLDFDVLASPAFRDCPPERREAMAPVYSVHRDYLDAMFESLDSRHGSAEAFLTGPVGLGAADLSALRGRLLA